MTTIFRLNDSGIAFQVKLTDCIDESEFDMNSINEQYIIFTKPDGVKLEKSASIYEDPQDGSLIIYTIPIDESILDLIGPWAYAGRIITIDGAFTTSSSLFWVV